MIWIDLGIGIVAAAAWIAILAFSDRNPDRRLWPPRQGNWGTAVWAWALTILIYVGVIRAAGDDFNVLGLPAWLRWSVGGGVSIAGSALQTWAAAQLGFKGTSGWNAGLVTTGAYRLMRHPQYLGQIATLLGIAFFAGSILAWIPAIAGCAALAYAGRVEDRHLARTQEGHDAYAARVGAFV